MSDPISLINAFWLIFCAVLVLFMQGGFLCIESGLTRSKNSINVALKNVMDLFIAIIIFWALGFGLMYGGSDAVFNGQQFFIDFRSVSLEQTSVFLFQMTFCATSATIVSGAIAERARFSAYLILTAGICIFVYPVFGQWAWGGLLSGTPGWLESRGFIDFAGGTVVHSVGGWVALAAIIVIGPRLWRFHSPQVQTLDTPVNNSSDTSSSTSTSVVSTGHVNIASNMPLAMMGMVFFIIGWIGFNAGSSLNLAADTPHIIINTLIAASAGGLVSASLSHYFDSIPINLSHSIINGVLSGLVAITAACYAVGTAEAAFIGGVGAAICIASTLTLWKCQLDDPIGSISVHLAAGIWGTLAVGIFGDPDILNTGLTKSEQIVVQLQGIIVCGIYVFSASYLLLWLINKVNPLRVSEEEENAGLNISEHGASTELHELVMSMEYIRDSNDLSHRANVEPFSEVGYVAQSYNQLMATLESASNRIALVVKDIKDAVITIDSQGTVISLNPSAEDMFGVIEKEMKGHSIEKILREDEAVNSSSVHAAQDDKPQDGKPRTTTKNDVLALLAEKPDDFHEIFGWKSDGEKILVEFSSSCCETPSGLEYTVIIRDVTEHKRMEAKVRSQKELAQVTLESIREAIITCNKSTEVVYLNPQAQQMVGYSNKEAYKKSINDVLSLVTMDGDKIDMGFSLLSSSPLEEDLLLYRMGKKAYTVMCRWSSLNDENGDNDGYVLALRDVTRSRKLQQQLSFQAKHDPLTGLVNRREFENNIEQAIRSTKNNTDVHLLCYIDLDQFKIVNDTCGHKAGDELLKQLSKVLSKKLRKSDSLGRLGGDEFSILMLGCTLEKGLKLAEGLRKRVEEFRFSWEKQQFSVGASIGIVVINSETKNVSEVMAQADTACYAAKDLGRNRVQVYHFDDVNVAERKGEMQWATRLRRAIDENCFQLYYQLICPTNNIDKIDHYEIFIRMIDDDGSIIPPGAFIPAAERYDLMVHIDRWVIKNTLIWMRKMYDAGKLSFQCSLNLSGASVGDDNCLNDIVNELKRSPHIANKLCFEITETAAMQDTGRAQEFIKKIKAYGCQFSLDDFGSGLSSFAYLKNLNVDYLKIDGGFVRDIDHDPIDRAMVESINTVGHVMGLKTIAEYVENEEILKELEKIGVDFVQGYYVGKPQPIEVID